MKKRKPPKKMAASLARSKVESNNAPHAFSPLFDALATAPSKRSESTNRQTKITPIKNSPFGKKYKAQNIVPKPPIVEIVFALTPKLTNFFTTGEIILATGSRNERCNIIPIVGLPPMSNLINARFILGISPENQQIATALGLPVADIQDPTLITADVVVVVASAKTGIDSKILNNWPTFRELYIPTIVIVIDFEDGDVDFEDMCAIVGRMLEPVLTPYLVLHADDGQPTAVINLEDQMITDYSAGKASHIPSEKEHRELVLDFKEELSAALSEGGWDQFVQGLLIPAIPLIFKNNLGIAEVKRFLNMIPTRGQ